LLLSLFNPNGVLDILESVIWMKLKLFFNCFISFLFTNIIIISL
jgi:hypothetical protein